MWFFGNKEEKISWPPTVEAFKSRIIHCRNCGAELDFSECEGLTDSACYECELPFIVPYHISKFWIFGICGEGGMGSVYRAISENEEAECEFAIKLLPPGQSRDPFLIASLLEEARIASTFGIHPHLSPIEEYGDAKGDYYVAMEMIPGRTLDEVIDNEVQIEYKRIIKWILQLLSAEQRICEKGYLYRDLKPQNIIIDDDDNVCLIDYGLCAKLENVEKLNQGDDLQGSPHFLPPERIIGDPEDWRGEIYSLGMILFYCLTKQTYYSPTEISGLIKKHVVSLRFASVQTRLPSNVKKNVADVIDKMIARDPEKRYSSFVELAKELKVIYKQM